jgi:hypothetical protein
LGTKRRLVRRWRFITPPTTDISANEVRQGPSETASCPKWPGGTKCPGGAAFRAFAGQGAPGGLCHSARWGTILVFVSHHVCLPEKHQELNERRN